MDETNEPVADAAETEVSAAAAQVAVLAAEQAIALQEQQTAEALADAAIVIEENKSSERDQWQAIETLRAEQSATREAMTTSFQSLSEQLRLMQENLASASKIQEQESLEPQTPEKLDQPKTDQKEAAQRKARFQRL